MGRPTSLLPVLLCSILLSPPAIAQPAGTADGAQRGIATPSRPAAVAPDERRVALVIGNSAYKNLPQLANPKVDAQGVAAALKKDGFELVGGGARIDLTYRELQSAIREFSGALHGGAVAVFYYAGHGVELGGRNFLVPVDGNPQTVADADFELVDVDLVMKQLRVTKNRLNIVVLDACRNNPFGGRGLRSGNGLAEITDRPSGTLISYAAAAGKVARDGPPGTHSPYSAALIDAIQRPGLNVLDVFNQVAVSVEEQTKGEQQPWVSNTAIRGQFFFVPPSASAAKADVAAFEFIKNSTNAEDFREFVQQFPDSPYAGFAARRATELASKQANGTPPSRNTADYLTHDPASGSLRTGEMVLVDDGSCPTGKIKQVTGGNKSSSKAGRIHRSSRCIDRP